MAIPEISSTNGASTKMNFCSFGLSITYSFEKNGMDLLRKLKQDSCESITPSNSKIFLIQRTKSTFSCISETKVKTSNLWPCMSTVTGITNSTQIY